MKQKKFLTWKECYELGDKLYNKIMSLVHTPKNVKIYGVPRGGICAAQCVVGFHAGVELVENPEDAHVFVDDIIDSGETAGKYLMRYPYIPFFGLIEPPEKDENVWYVFPWETTEQNGPEDNIRRLLEYIGEDPNREGLLETPKRILKSYDRLFGGYKKKPEDLMKVFEDGACNEMVILKNIKFYSTCEHHMLPFHGVAHVAYIPNGKVIGVSKLARLVDMYARRMQIQERIGTQVVEALMTHLEAKGAACIIEAQHMCMTARGVENQTSILTTSALRGAFLDNIQTRMEFLQMIKEK